MQDEVKRAFTMAINRSLPVARELAAQFVEPYLVWHKDGDGQWRSAYEQRPSLVAIFSEGRQTFEKMGAEFIDAFVRHYPEYGGMVGFRSFGGQRLLHDPSYILCFALVTLWERHGSFDVGLGAIEAIVREFGEFVDLSAVQIRFQAPLSNFRMPVESIELPAGLRIRRLNEQEVSDIHGGSNFQRRFTSQRGYITHEFEIEGEYEEPKILGDLGDYTPLAHNQVRSRLDKAILTLRTFKEGRVGYDYIRFKAVKFCPLQLMTLTYGDLYVPFGRYELSNEEIEPLHEYAGRIFAFSEPAMEMACCRLSDAQARLGSRDRLVDAVVGLEALLLAGLRSEDRRGELKYRFSLHYSTLFSSPEERYRAFRIAKDLYDLRSTVAHGGVLKEGNCRVGDEKLTIDAAANRACEALRKVINRFLPHTDAQPYFYCVPSDRCSNRRGGKRLCRFQW